MKQKDSAISFIEDGYTDFKQPYEMKFSDDGNQDPKRNNDRRQNGNNKGGTPNRGYISIILFAIAFITLVALMLYFFVFNTSSPTLTANQNDIVYNIDTDNDGKANLTEDGYPDFSGMDTSTQTFTVKSDSNPNGVIMNDSNLGALAEVLIDPTTYKPVITVTKSVNTSDTYAVSGTMYRLDSKTNKSVKYSFSINGAITKNYYDHYLSPILSRVQVKNSDSGKYVNYYTTSTFLYSEQSTSSVASWLVPLIFSVIAIAVVFWLVNRMFKGVGAGGGSNPMAGFVNNVARKESTSKVRFADVAGCDEAKAELVEMVDYFHSTDKYTRLGAKLPHGVLLVGPPGTGKTLLAKAVAGEASVPFYSISGSDFVEMYVGVGASRVRSLFKTAKQNAPCLIFIDEIDAVGRQRGAGLGGGNDEREQTLNELLVEMDGFEDNNGVIVMAATNRSDVLDPALTRPGRFDRTITVDLPDRLGRAAILKVHSRNKKLAPNVSFDDIAGRTVGFSGADLANIMNDAAILAVRANRSAITTADIDEAIDRAIAGPAKKSHLEPSEKKQVAYHESGHAVIGIFLPYSDVVQKITIIPRGRTGGHVLMTPAQDHFLMTKNQMLARITGYLGGRTSEEIFFGDVSTGASNDIEVATQLARSMVTQYGMSDLGPVQYERPGGSVFLGRDYNSTQSNYSTQIAFEIDKAVRAIIDECHEQATKLLTEHKDDVQLIADTLIQNETITADQITYLLKNRKLPPVDEALMTSKSGMTPKNANNIVLYPGYESFYCGLDKVMLGKPSRLVLVIATANGHPISDAEYKKACTVGAPDPSHIGMFFITFSQSSHISLTVETFASHLEAYTGVPTLLIKTDDYSVSSLRGTYEKSEKTAEETNRPGVVKEILPAEKKDDVKTDKDVSGTDSKEDK